LLRIEDEADNAIQMENARRNKALDRLLLLAFAIVIAVLGVAAFWIADDHHVNPGWVIAAGAGVVFVLVVGWGYRSKFRSPGLIAFFTAWLFVHVGILLLVLGWLGILYYLPFLVAELWVGYMIAIWLFGPPPSRGFR
jgi:hypothetical protein